MDPSCGGLLIQPNGWIYSPDRDGDGHYEPVEDCYWQIGAPHNHYIVLRAHFMDIENIPKCAHDFLEVSFSWKESTANKMHLKFIYTVIYFTNILLIFFQ